MIDINTHPIWDGSPIWGKVGKFKKKVHLARFFIAKQYAKLFPRSMFIGVTGSVGKTLTTKASQEVLSEKFNTISTKGDLDPIFNIPLTILRIRPKVKKVVLEMGIEYPGEMEYYLSFVKPKTAILTNVSFAHNEFLGDLNDAFLEKSKLVKQLPHDGLGILNWDDPLVRKAKEETKAQVIYFGLDEKNCDVWAGNIKIKDFKTTFELNYGVERVEILSNLLGIHQVYPLLAASALGIANSIPLTKIKKALERLTPPPHRMNVLNGFNGSIVIDDSYNAAFESVEEALETLNYVPARRRILVIGEMRELGLFINKLHLLIAQKIFKDKIDIVLLGRGKTKIIYDELIRLGFLPEKIHGDLQNPQIVSKLFKILGKGDIVLVKGARANRLDEVVKKITK